MKLSLPYNLIFNLKGRKNSFFVLFWYHRIKNSFEKDGKVAKKTCVECGSHVPIYQNFMCEDCWRDALNEKMKHKKKRKR